MKLWNSVFFCFLVIGCTSEQLYLEFALLEEFSLIERYDTDVSTVFDFSSGEDRLTIEQISGIDDDSAATFVAESKFMLEALYSNTLSAYPGSITQEIVCDDGYRPAYSQREVQGMRTSHYLLYATPRYGLGACSEDLVAFRHLYGWISCSDRLFVIQLYRDLDTPFSELEDFFFSMKCL